MELRRDEKGRPVGLAWPEKPEFKPEVIRKAYTPAKQRSAGQNQGRARQDTCIRGHDLNEHGREIKRGGRYCAICRKDTSERWRAANPEKVRESRQKYNERKKKEQEDAAR